MSKGRSAISLGKKERNFRFYILDWNNEKNSHLTQMFYIKNSLHKVYADQLETIQGCEVWGENSDLSDLSWK